jgi:hypothetical protein
MSKGHIDSTVNTEA